MKKLALLLLLLFVPVTPVKAQQTNTFDICNQIEENYSPGSVNSYGRYTPGNINSYHLNVDCNNPSIILHQRRINTQPPVYRQPSSYRIYRVRRVNYYQRPSYYCSPTRTILGATLGGSIGRALTSTRNNRRNRGWATVLGASLGGLAFSC